MAQPPKSLNELLDRLDEVAGKHGEVSVRQVMDAVGRRSFGPLLLVVGAVGLAPGIGDIPGVATVLGLLVLTVSAQILCGRSDFWLPRWILNRKADSGKVEKMAASPWLRKPAKWADKAVVERLRGLTGHAGTSGIAAACVVMALGLPFTEVVPMSTNLLCLSLLAYGLSLVAHDGLMALIGFCLSAALLVLLVMGLW